MTRILAILIAALICGDSANAGEQGYRAAPQWLYQLPSPLSNNGIFVTDGSGNPLISPRAAVNVFSSGGDDTASIAAAIATGASMVVLPNASYNISSTITLANNQCVLGGNAGFTVLNWTGGNSTDFISTNNAGTNNWPCMKNVTLNSGSATNLTLLHLVDTQLGDFEQVYLNANNGSGNVCMYMQAGVNGTGASHNTGLNHFQHLFSFGCQTGFRASGNATGPTVVTDNNFYDIDMEASNATAGTMYDFVQWADTNNFYYARATIFVSNSSGVVCNSGTPGSNVGVYDNNFYYLDVDAFGAGTGQTGLTINWCKQFGVYGFYHSPDSFPGTVLNASANAQSYYIVDNGAAPNIISLNYNETKLGNPGFSVGQLSLQDGSSFATHLNVDSLSDFSILNDLSLFETTAGGNFRFEANSAELIDYGFTTSSVFTVTPTINMVGTIQAGGTAGVTCSGTPTASFATKNGIVTHC